MLYPKELGVIPINVEEEGFPDLLIIQGVDRMGLLHVPVKSLNQGGFFHTQRSDKSHF